jgi:hypothetical protein
MREIWNLHRILVGKRIGKSLLGKFRKSFDDNAGGIQRIRFYK